MLKAYLSAGNENPIRNKIALSTLQKIPNPESLRKDDIGQFIYPQRNESPITFPLLAIVTHVCPNFINALCHTSSALFYPFRVLPRLTSALFAPHNITNRTCSKDTKRQRTDPQKLIKDSTSKNKTTHFDSSTLAVANSSGAHFRSWKSFQREPRAIPGFADGLY